MKGQELLFTGDFKVSNRAIAWLACVSKEREIEAGQAVFGTRTIYVARLLLLLLLSIKTVQGLACRLGIDEEQHAAPTTVFVAWRTSVDAGQTR